MGIALNEINKNSKGGTELSIGELGSSLPQELLDQFHIIPSRFRGTDPGKYMIYWAHDLIGDPECDHLKAGGYNQYEKLVFVSNWQMQRFIDYYGIPWRKCVVLPNAIHPIEHKEKSTDKINIIYHTTPHRGLSILVPVFEKLAEQYEGKIDLHLDVFSSFNIYGWPERDKDFEPLFERCRNHPKISYHNSAEQQQVRAALQDAHIFAYPSIWQETGCRSLMEGMSAGLLCIHSNFGCLAETAAGWTWMYQYHENARDHINVFYQHMTAGIESLFNQEIQSGLKSQQTYANIFYNWEMRKHQWQSLLKSILREKGRK